MRGRARLGRGWPPRSGRTRPARYLPGNDRRQARRPPGPVARGTGISGGPPGCHNRGLREHPRDGRKAVRHRLTPPAPAHVAGATGRLRRRGRQGPASALSPRFRPRETYRRDKPANGHVPATPAPAKPPVRLPTDRTRPAAPQRPEPRTAPHGTPGRRTNRKRFPGSASLRNLADTGPTPNRTPPTGRVCTTGFDGGSAA